MTATDLSETAIRQAAAKADDQGLAISFRQGDILNSYLDQSFDLILDGGCFHVLPTDSRVACVQTVANLLKPKRHLLLKGFSDQETREASPYRFTLEEIQQIFRERFHLRSVEQTVYQGNPRYPSQSPLLHPREAVTVSELRA